MTREPKYNFGSIVVVEENLVGVVVKSRGPSLVKGLVEHEVYVRSFNQIKTYEESELRNFIYDKELSAEDLEYYE